MAKMDIAEFPSDCLLMAGADVPPAVGAKVGFDTIELLLDWLQSELGADASLGAALSQAFEEQARNAVGPHKLAISPFVPPAALLALLDSLPEHLRQRQQVGMPPHMTALHGVHGGAPVHRTGRHFHSLAFPLAYISTRRHCLLPH